MLVGATAGGPGPDTPAANLPRLTSLRALAALLVFLYHVQLFGVLAPGRAPMTIGYVGVSFFFILSGFVLTWSWVPGSKAVSFYRRRFARIYPAYAFVLVVTGVAGSPAAPPVSARGVGLSSVLLQSWSLHNGSIVHALNPPSWSLSDEAFFYVLLPLVLPFLLRRRTLVAVAMAGAWFVATGAIVVYGSHIGSSWEYIDFTFPVVRSGEFFVGVAAALALRRGIRLPAGIGLAAVGVSVLAVMVAPGWTPLPDVLLDPLFLAVIVLAAQRDLAGRRGMFTRSAAVYAGGISYAFYLVHQFAIVEVKADLGTGVGVALLSLAVAILAAAAVHHGVERPGRRLLMTSRARRQAVPPSG